MQERLRDPDSRKSQSLAVVHQAGLLELIDGPLAMSQDIAIISLLGETLGHIGVRAHINNETYLCIGDLYHHPIEMIYGHWMPLDADIGANLQSRARFVQEASTSYEPSNT